MTPKPLLVGSAPVTGEARFMRALCDCGPLRSAFKSHMWAKVETR